MRRLTARTLTTVLALALPALGAAGCDSTTTPTSTDTTGTPVTITETYSGTVAVNGAATFSFGVTAAGSVTATYKTISPTATATMGIALGVWNGTSCNVVIANDNAIVNTTVVGTASAAGTLCVRAYDIGKLTATQNIEVAITHF